MPRRRRASDNGPLNTPGMGRVPERVPSTRSDEFPVVAIGASAGGLEAFQNLFDALPADSGMAFILVQHLDPNHQSMMVELLSRHTSMKVRHATDGMVIEPNSVYVLPPGFFLAVRSGALYLSEPRERHGARLPFDFLLHSMAVEFGERAICVILSGTGSDGSAGLKSIKEKFGLVIAQDPDECAHDGMPQSAIMTGAVDLVLPVARMPAAFANYDRRMALTRRPAARTGSGPDWLPTAIDLLRTRTGYDFTFYKPGTLQRRIERRMAMATIESDDIHRYLDALRNDPVQLDLLAKDLLINVTSFLRDPKVFDFLAEKIIPDLVRKRPYDAPLRIWVVGCSTGEEAYSLVMLVHEEIARTKHRISLQVFASDVDADAIAQAREGLYPHTIESEVSPERLKRFFRREDQGYRVSQELRAAVVFSVQDVLVDPPFSRLDMISCRNMLIYLRPEAQAKVISFFHFALINSGLLLLGTTETVGDADDRFKLIAKPERLYQHIGRHRPGELGVALGVGGAVRAVPRPVTDPPRSKRAALAELCERLVMRTHAPAAVLINSKYECLYSMGPTDRFLRVVPGQPTHDVFAMARDGVRTKLRAAIQQATKGKERVLVGGAWTILNGARLSFDIDVQPAPFNGEELLLVCFLERSNPEIEAPDGEGQPDRAAGPRNRARIQELELELNATRAELESTIRNLESSIISQKEIAEDTLSVNEEFQAANEELLTSKEELQSLNEELTALNGQLQETLQQQRTTSNDLQNILYSTSLATLFLDRGLRIRYFTPAIRSLFHVQPEDIGRPLADLNYLAADQSFPEDARAVLKTLEPVDRQVESLEGSWYIRRMLPYRTGFDEVEGLVITFIDITERKRIADALDVARQAAEQANLAKSRFLAAASHDLRQPLQTLVLLQGLLAKIVVGEKAQLLVARFGETATAMVGLLNSMLDINRIEAGVIHADKRVFQIDDLLVRMRDEFTYYAQAKGLELRVVRSGAAILSDPQLLEQIIRNLISNALKYTEHGKVLLGCRRHEGTLSIEVWDTGIGIASEKLRNIFREYYQVADRDGKQGQGLGLGLSIVHRLAALLGHRIEARSNPGRGSAFTVEVALVSSKSAPRSERALPSGSDGPKVAEQATGAILVVEDDPEVRDLLHLALTEDGHRVVVAADAFSALELLGRGVLIPDLIVADYGLPGGMSGLQFANEVLERLHRAVPVIILTGDISTETLRGIASRRYTQLHKPVKLEELSAVVQRLLPASLPAMRPAAPPTGRLTSRPEAGPAAGPAAARDDGEGDAASQRLVYVVDDDRSVRETLGDVLTGGGWTVQAYPTAEAFLEAFRPDRAACLLVDAYLPGMSGFELVEQLGTMNHRLASVMITGHGDVHMAVQAMKSGISDFIEKPIDGRELLASVGRAYERASDVAKQQAWRNDAANSLARLTTRQREVLRMIIAGNPNKNIAADLAISQRTVENHRAEIMKRTGAKSLAGLVRLSLAAVASDSED